MARYQTFTTVGDMGAWVSKLILELPSTVRAHEVSSALFNVYVERIDTATGKVSCAKVNFDDVAPLPGCGYVPVRDAYVCDETGKPAAEGTHVALTLPECRLTKHIDSEMMGSSIRRMDFRVTQLADIPAEEPGGYPVMGLVFDECTGDVCPQLAGWHLDASGTFAGIELNYGWFEPNVALINAFRAMPGFFHKPPLPEKLPLVIWLHGAAEGCDPYLSVAGNKAVALSEPDIQGKLGGAAYVLVPASPTFWMDTENTGQMNDDNQSYYTKALKALIDEFIAEHAASIDTDRIYIGGLSNGGFMTCRMIVDYPDFFAAAVPACAPWVAELSTDEEFAAMAKTPSWWVQSDDDPIVPPATHFKPTWKRLMAAGATDTHATYYDHIEDETGVYHDADGRPTRFIGHLVWINVYNDACRTDIDGSLVRCDGFPVTLWQWVGQHTRG